MKMRFCSDAKLEAFTFGPKKSKINSFLEKKIDSSNLKVCISLRTVIMDDWNINCARTIH